MRALHGLGIALVIGGTAAGLYGAVTDPSNQNWGWVISGCYLAAFLCLMVVSLVTAAREEAKSA